MENKQLSFAIEYRNNKEYEKSLNILLELVKTSTNPEVFYQCAWTHDVMELEREAIFYYETAIKMGLSGDSLMNAYIGLGSTYRCIGNYEKAIFTLENGLKLFPDNDVLKTFLAMTKYNIGNYNDSIQLLMELVSKLDSVSDYKNAILFYKDKLNEKF